MPAKMTMNGFRNTEMTVGLLFLEIVEDAVLRERLSSQMFAPIWE